MDIIKFQVWHTVIKAMYDVYATSFNEDGSLDMVTTRGGHGAFTGKCILRQFTGLHDKNGKEAYHHDLFLHKYRNEGKPIEIIWEDGGWRGQYVGSDFQFLLNQWELDRGEIIGDIYQNPELVE